MRLSLLLWISAGAALGLSLGACDDDCPVGAEGCACSEVGGCYAGLACVDDECAEPGETDGATEGDTAQTGPLSDGTDGTGDDTGTTG